MKLPLLFGANPRNKPLGPVVMLGAGGWVINSNHKDSHILIGFVDDNSVPLVLKEGMVMRGPKKVQLTFGISGSEPSVDVFATKLPIEL